MLSNRTPASNLWYGINRLSIGTAVLCWETNGIATEVDGDDIAIAKGWAR